MIMVYINYSLRYSFILRYQLKNALNLLRFGAPISEILKVHVTILGTCSYKTSIFILNFFQNCMKFAYQHSDYMPGYRVFKTLVLKCGLLLIKFRFCLEYQYLQFSNVI